MKGNWKAGLLLLAAAVTSIAAEGLTDRELKAKYYEDLGTEAVDVTRYPKAQQEGYKAFAQTCSKCHTLARPINAPIVSKEDWRRFIKRMHLRAMDRSANLACSPEECAAIVDFLAYDSKVRKVDHKKDFDAETAALKARFAVVSAQRAQAQAKADQKKAKPYGDSATPAPQP